MTKTIKEERLRWVLPIYKKEITLVDMARVCPHSKRSLERWLNILKKKGVWALEPKSTEPDYLLPEIAALHNGNRVHLVKISLALLLSNS